MGVTMKSRLEIIQEILAKNRKLSFSEREANLEFALKGMQDALLFQLAEDLGIHITKNNAGVSL